jgi:hypothetical protein
LRLYDLQGQYGMTSEVIGLLEGQLSLVEILMYKKQILFMLKDEDKLKEMLKKRSRMLTKRILMKTLMHHFRP